LNGKPVTISLFDRRGKETIVEVHESFVKRSRPSEERQYFDVTCTWKNRKLVAISYRYRKPKRLTKRDHESIDRALERQLPDDLFKEV